MRLHFLPLDKLGVGRSAQIACPLRRLARAVALAIIPPRGLHNFAYGGTLAEIAHFAIPIFHFKLTIKTITFNIHKHHKEDAMPHIVVQLRPDEKLSFITLFHWHCHRPMRLIKLKGFSLWFRGHACTICGQRVDADPDYFL